MSKLLKIILSSLLIFGLVYILMLVGPGFRFLIGANINEVIGDWEGSITTDNEVIPIRATIVEDEEDEGGILTIINTNTNDSQSFKVQYEKSQLSILRSDMSFTLVFEKREKEQRVLQGQAWNFSLNGETINGDVFLKKIR